MSNGWQYVVPGYAVTFGSLGAYTLWLVRRGRRVAQQIPEDRRRFLD